MKQLFDQVSVACSRLATRAYSSSFSIGIYCLKKPLRDPIYSIYGFVRFADEIVDTFHDYDKEVLFKEFCDEVWKAIDRKISTNPILNSFQQVVHQFDIEPELITCFLKSMETDLYKSEHTADSYDTYILGSAEVVGLMCLRVFTEGDHALYEQLKPGAMKLGAAFQKVNFLRDLKNDYVDLGRVYFPGVDFKTFTEHQKREIEQDIHRDFVAAFEGIKYLPANSRFGVYVAYVYYRALFNKISKVPSARIFAERIRISDREKIRLLCSSYLRHTFSLL